MTRALVVAGAFAAGFLVGVGMSNYAWNVEHWGGIP